MPEATGEHKEKQQPISPLSSGRGALDSFGIAIFFIVVFEVALLFGMNYLQDKRISDTTELINQHKQKLSTGQYKEINEKVEDVLKSEAALKKALDEKVVWSRLYSQMNAITPKNVQIRSVNIDDKGTIRLQGVTPTLTSLAKTIVTYNKGSAKVKSPFTNVEMQSHSFIEEEGKKLVSFGLSGKINFSLSGSGGCAYFYAENCIMENF